MCIRDKVLNIVISICIRDKVLNKKKKHFRKILILDAWLGPEHASADSYITGLKFQIRLWKGERQVKMELF